MSRKISVQEICAAVRGQLLRGDKNLSVTIKTEAADTKTADVALLRGISIDTRTIAPGDIFFAISGENFDGHAFLKKADEKNASVCIVSKIPENLETFKSAVIQVKNTKIALADFAADHRKKIATQTKIVGICGSCGKTTVKEMIAQILSFAGSTTYSYGNFNNEIGCPLSLLRLQPENKFGVFEIGSSAKGEVQRLSQAVGPEVAILTNIYLEHTATFGTLQDIAEGESEILLNLSETGYAILPQEDALLNYLKSRLPQGRKILTFGLKSDANIFVETFPDYPKNETFVLAYQENGAVQKRLHCQIPLLGEHNILNAAAAAAAAIALNIPDDIIEKGLKFFKPQQMRFQILKSKNGATIVNDCYNSNPGSLRAAVQSFVAAFPHKKKCAVLGDMLELGKISKQEHENLAEFLSAMPLEKIVLYGAECQSTREKFPQGKAFHSLDQNKILSEVKAIDNAENAILFKASRGMQLEKIIEPLL